MPSSSRPSAHVLPDVRPRRRPRAVALLPQLVSFAFVLAGCSPSLVPAPTPGATEEPTPSTAAPSPSPAATPCREPLRVALVTDVGGILEATFNAGAHEGLLRAAADGCIEPVVVETRSAADYGANIEAAVADGAAVVVGVGLFMVDALGDAATDHPEVRFVAVDAIPTAGHDAAWSRNGESLVFAEDELGYVAGILAASLTETGVVGAVGALDVPPVEAFVEGFRNGAKALHPSVRVPVVYGPGFGDPAAGRAAAGRLISTGADVVFAASGLAGVPGRVSKDLTSDAALVAACAGGALVIGAEVDQWVALPEARSCLVTSVVKNVAGAVSAAIERIRAGRFEPGLRVERAATGGIGWAPFRDLEARVPAAVRERLAATLEGLADGRVSTGVVVDGVTPSD